MGRFGSFKPTRPRRMALATAVTASSWPDNVIEIYEIPYSTTVEAILDKVAELVKAGRIKEIADMRDEPGSPR